MLKNLINDTMVYGASIVLNKLMALLIVPIYARVLTTEDFGLFDVAFTFATLLNVVASLEILQGVSRFWPEQKDWYSKRLLASTGFWFVLGINTILAVGFIFITVLFVDAEFLNGIGFIVSIDIILYSFCYCIYSYLINQFRWEMRSKEYTFVVCFMTFLNLILLVIFCILLDKGLHGALMAQTISYLIAGIVSITRLRNTFLFKFNLHLLKAMIGFSFPLVFSGLAVFFISYANRFSLGYFASLEEIGKLAVIMKIGGLVSLIYSGVQIALTPIIYNNYENRSTPINISRFFTWFFGFSVFSVCVITLFSNELIIVFVGEKYSSVSPLVMYASIGLLLSQMYIFAPGLPLAKKSKLQLLATVVSGILSIMLNFILVKIFLLSGAVLAFMLSNASFFFLWAIWGNRYYPIPWQWRKIVLSLIIAATAVLCNIVVELNSDFFGRYIFYILKIIIAVLVFITLAYVVKSLPTVSKLKKSLRKN